MALSIAFLGRGGQGIVFAAEVVAETFFRMGMYVAQMQSYGAEVRGGSVLAYVVVDEKPIENPFVESFSIAIALHDAGVRRWRRHVENTAIVLYDSDLAKSLEGLGNAIPIPIARKCMERGVGGRENIAAIGLLTNLVIDRGTVVEILKIRKDFEKNLRALEIGIELSRGIDRERLDKALRKQR